MIKWIRGVFGGKADVHAATNLNDPSIFRSLTSDGMLTATGKQVPQSRALKISPYFAALRNISEDMGKLPLLTYERRTGTGSAGRGRDRADGHPVAGLLNRKANKELSSVAFKETLTLWALTWGNGFAEIERNGFGDPIGLWPIHPSRVKIRRIDDELFYMVRPDGRVTGDAVAVPAADMFHLRGIGEGTLGYSILSLARESLGLAVNAQDYAAAFLDNSATPGGVLETPNELKGNALDNLRQSWADLHQGSQNAGRVAILEQDLKWKSINMPLKDAQFLESRQFQVIDIARWFRMPPHKLQDLERATFSNVEEQNVDYVSDTLQPWSSRWESEASIKLFPEDGSAFAEFQYNALLRGDQKSRGDFYTALFNLGALSPNDVRDMENLNPIGEAGDQYFLQLNLAPLASASDDPDPGFDSPRSAATVAALKPVFVAIAGRMVGKERNARERGYGKQGAAEFYAKHREHIIEAMAPAFESLGLPSTCSESWGQWVNAYCEISQSMSIPTAEAFAQAAMKFADLAIKQETANVDA